MKSSARLALIALVVIVIAILLWLWLKGDPKPEAVVAPAAVADIPPPKPEAPLIAPVFFGYNSSQVLPEETKILDDSIEKIKGMAYERLDLVGHADRIGTEPFNDELSRERAKSVRDYLVGKSLDAGRIRISAMGETTPVTGEACKNLIPERRDNQKLVECLARDRRVEIKFVALP
ncbi:MAG: OmpA family protein [Burkholderiales bacterium]